MGELNQNGSDSLEDLYVRFAEAILALMESWAASEGVLENPQWEVDFSGTYPVEMLERIPDYRALLMAHYTKDSLWLGEEAVHCARKHWEEGILPPQQVLIAPRNANVPLTFETVQQSLVYELLRPVIDVLNRQDTFHPTSGQILASYHFTRELWSNQQVMRKVIVPLLNLQGDIDQQVAIDSRLHLAPLTSGEKFTMWNRHGATQEHISLEVFSSVSFKLAYSNISRQDEPPDTDLLSETMQIISALRLLKAGNVGASFMLEIIPMISHPDGFPIYMALEDCRVQQGSPPYILNSSDLPTVRFLLEALLHLDGETRGGLAIALRRFNQAYNRESGEDRIIDLTIALESTLLAKLPSQTELKYRFALRGAALLAAKRSPREIQSFLQTMYDVRSKIVHEGQTLSELGKTIRKGVPLSEPHEFPQHCEEMVRAILREYMTRLAGSQSAKTVEAINSALERSIVDGLVSQPVPGEQPEQ